MLHLILIALVASPALSCDPQPVQNLTVALVRSSEIQVEWLQPSATEMQCVEGYQFCSTTQNGTMHCITVYNASLSDYIFTGLDNCMPYNLRVATFGNNKTSTPAYVSASTAPGLPGSLVWGRLSESAITVSWTYVLPTERNCAQQFVLSLCYVLDTNCSRTAVERNGSNYSVEVPKLRNCQPYVLDLVVLDSTNQSSDSLLLNVDSDTPDPQPVQNLTVALVRSSEIRVGWLQPSTTEMHCMLGYQFCSMAQNGTMHCITVQNDSLSDYIFTGLDNCMPYNLSVAAFGNNNMTSTPAYVSASTAPAPSGSLVWGRLSESTITVSWIYVLPTERNCAQRFVLSLCYVLGTNCSSRTAVELNGSDYSVEVPKLRECQPYVLDLVVLDSTNQSSDSLLLIVDADTPDPQPVQNLTVALVRSSEIRVGWLQPSTTEMQCVLEYQFCSTAQNDTMYCITDYNASLSDYIFTGLDNCMPYNLSVAAVGKNNVTSSAYVSASTAPRPSNNLRVARWSESTILVSWTYVLPTERNCAQRFVLSLCDVQGTNCSSRTIVELSGSQYSVLLPKPRECRPYLLDLVVLDSANQSSDSMQFNGEADVINVPENLTVSNVTSSSFALEWEIPDSQASCEYTVYVTVAYMVEPTTYHHYTMYNSGHTTHLQANVTSCTACNVSVSFAGTDSPMNTSTKVYTLPQGDKIFDNATVQGTTSSSVTVAWNTSLPVTQCIEAYSVCWEKRDTAGTSCQNASTNASSLQITGLAANSRYYLSLTALLYNGGHLENVTLAASTKSGAARILRSSLVGISTITLCLLTFSI